MSTDQTIDGFIERVTPHLPEGWTFDRAHDLGVHIRRDSKPFLYAYLDTYSKRVTITISLPEGSENDDVPHHIERPRVTVAVDRDGKALAKDIVRRMADDAEAFQVAVTKRMNDRIAYELEVRNHCAALIEAGGGIVDLLRHGDAEELRLYSNEPYAHADIQPGSESVHFKRMTLPTALAVKVVALIAEEVSR